jgi:trimeric autotransporter adhesin
MLFKTFAPRLFVAAALAGLLGFSSILASPAAAQGASLPVATKPIGNRLTQPIDEKNLVTLANTVHPLARAANDRGLAPDSMQLDRIQIVLQRSDAQEASLKQLVAEMHNPNSGNYHHWLTPQQFGEQFGPSDADLATLQTWLQGHGFGQMKVHPGHQTMEITGSAAQFREAFHAQIHKYEVNGRTHYANATNPQIPAAIAPLFSGFTSLNNFDVKSHSRLLGKAEYNTRSGRAKPDWTVSSDYGESFVLSPGDFAVQYDLNPLYSNGTDGTGQTIAIVNEANINVSLVNSFRALFGLPFNPPNIIIDGNDPGINGNNNPDEPNGASSEAYLDVEWSGAVAPKATIDLVIAGDTALSSGLILAMNHAVYENVAPVISLSFGACEASLGSTNGFLNSLWEQAAAQGITVVVSTGDNGSAGCDNPDTQDYATSGKNISGFASTPYDVAVGGTDFFYSAYNQGTTAMNAELATYWDTTLSNSSASVSIKGVIPEQAWNDSQYGSNFLHSTSPGTTIGAGSGGASAYGLLSTTGASTNYLPYPKPTWQQGDGVPADQARDIPDVSLFAAPGANATFYPVCLEDGDCQPVSPGETVQIYGIGGTSASAPSFAGMMALVNQKYGRQGQADFVLYPLAAQFPAAFHDVVQGTNSVPCAKGSTDCIAVANPGTDTDGTVEGQIGDGSTPLYDATAGYDLATGLGTIDANAMISNWGSVTFASTTTTLTPSATSFTHGTAITLYGRVTGGGTPTGSVAVMTDNTDPLQAGQAVFELSGGSYSGTYNALPGGTYNIWGQYGGDGVNGASTSSKTSITVTPEDSQIRFGVLEVTSQGSEVITSGSQVAYGTQLVLTAVPSPKTGETNDGIPTGAVSFADNKSSLMTVNLNQSGEASYNAPFTVGSHSVAASYSGDSSYSSSSAPALAFSVVKDTPLVGFSSPTEIGTDVFQGGGPIVFTVQLENGANSLSEQQTGVYMYSPVAPPTGTVTITGLPASVAASVALQSTFDLGSGFPEGVGTFTAATLANGTYNLRITYPGDANYNAINQSLSITVSSNNLLASTTTATGSSSSTSPTAAVTIAATVTGQTGKSAPTGTVSLSTSGYTISTMTLASTGGDVSTAAFVVNSSLLLPGVNTMTVQYVGDTVYQPSSTVVSVTNGLGPGLPGFAISATPVSIAQPGSSATSNLIVAPSNGFTGNVALTCTVTNPPEETNPPTCSAASANVVGDPSVSTVLTINTVASTPTASYTLQITGTSGGTTATTSIPVLVTAATAPGFTLAGGPIIITTPGTPGPSSITIAPTNGFTGAVALSCSVASNASGTLTLPTCSVSAAPAITGAAAVTSTLTVDTSSTTADGSYTVTITGTSGSITQTATALVTVSGTAIVPNFALSGTAITNATPGTPASSTVTVTPSGGFTGTVALSCAITTSPSAAHDLPTCTVAAPVAITGADAVTATLTINSTASTLASLRNSFHNLFALGGETAVAALFFFLPSRRRRSLKTLLLLIFAITAASSVVGCGSKQTAAAPTGGSGTTAGTYTVTVIGTSGNITQSTVASVVVN